MPLRAKIYIALTIACGAAVFGLGCLHWHSNDLLKFGCYFLIAVLASTMKVELPGIESAMSVLFLFILLGALELSLAETLVIGCTAVLAQSLWKKIHRPTVVQVVFNVASLANSIWLTYFAYHLSFGFLKSKNCSPLLLLVAACTFFLSNTLAVSMVIALVEKRPMRGIWTETYFWSLAYNLAGAAVVGGISVANHFIGWQNSLLILPIMYVVYRSYQLYLGRLEDQRKRTEIEELQVKAEKLHVEQVCALHLRTIEGLALAIEAKDHTTHQHLHRVRVYATAIAKEMGLSQEESDALQAAALLHDIGKLAVPDHILNKPGRLTPEEFEKMKIHPLVGADILEKVAFPYPVAPIVRAHHEKWNGKGYPDGLVGEAIPIGARILSAVDCLDALASDRQYRKALPLDQAIKVLVDESGVSYDPKVVKILERRYIELECAASASLDEASKNRLSFNYVVHRGEEPAVGFEVGNAVRPGSQTDFMSSIASARQEAHTLFELSQDLGNSLSLDETLSLVAMRLRKLVPYDAIVFLARKDGLLVPEFVSGDNFRMLSSLSIPVGTGLCGWVASNSRPILNGNPEVEIGFAMDAKNSTDLRSALVVPLVGLDGPIGVLALYQAEADAFTSDHLRVLQAITSKVALFMVNALKYRQAKDSATIDYLTGLPNARSLSLHLEHEIARCKREGSTMAVIVTDLDGFKKVNDVYGHLAGDNVLKLFGSMLRQSCREYDFAARMGGDEFVIIVPNITPASVRERTMLLSGKAQEAGREVCRKNLLSLSSGAAFFPKDGVDAEQLLAEADRKMYAAKNLHHEELDMISATMAAPSCFATIN